MVGGKIKKREYGEAALDLHRKIKGAIDASVETNRSQCVIVSSIKKRVKCDPRTLKFHLKLLEEDGYGSFSKDGKLFCCPNKKATGHD